MRATLLAWKLGSAACLRLFCFANIFGSWANWDIFIGENCLSKNCAIFLLRRTLAKIRILVILASLQILSKILKIPKS